MDCNVVEWIASIPTSEDVKQLLSTLHRGNGQWRWATAQTFQTFEMGETRVEAATLGCFNRKAKQKAVLKFVFFGKTLERSQCQTYFKQRLIMTGNYRHFTEDIPQKITPSSSFFHEKSHFGIWPVGSFNFSHSSLSVHHRHSASHHGHELPPGNPRAMHGPNRHCHPPAGGHFRPVDRWMILMKDELMLYQWIES